MQASRFRNVPWRVGACLLASPLFAQATERVSIASNGTEGNASSYFASISADGRFVSFIGLASNLVSSDTNGAQDVFLRDRQGGTTRRESVSSSSVQGDQHSSLVAISADGRFLAFMSAASNLVPGDANANWDVFVRDRVAGTTELASVDSNGVPGDGYSSMPSISADGRFVAFRSTSTNLVPGVPFGGVFVRDRLNGTTELVDVGTSGGPANIRGEFPSISADGRYVAFSSEASDLVLGDTNAVSDVFLRDRLNGTTVRVSVASDGAQASGDSQDPSISADGLRIAFSSGASDLVDGDTNGHLDVFVHDVPSGTTERVSVNTGGGQGDLGSLNPSLSGDGLRVAFQSGAHNLVPGDTNERSDVFLRDRLTGMTQRVSVDFLGAQSDSTSDGPSISADGRWVAFHGSARLVPGDSNAMDDVYVRDLEATGFASLCDAGVGGYAACPCSNPPAAPTRGCQNSSGTGGAQLTASGSTHLSADTLVFTTSGEKPTALSIVLQGNAFLDSGTTYGQGIRCVGGSLKRLYSKSAVGGSITAPDFGAGDLSVSAQSAAKGDLILPGEPRWYTVYYRDPIVLGGCPSSSTFNATQTGQVSWSP